MDDVIASTSGIVCSWLILGASVLLGITLFFRGRFWRVFKLKLIEKLPQETQLGVAIATTSSLGLGGITGIGTAIAIGGPGAMFWMWLFGILAVVIKFYEGVVFARAHSADALPTRSLILDLFSGKLSGLAPKIGFAVSLLIVGLSLSFGAAFQSAVGAAALRTWHVPGIVTGILFAIAIALLITQSERLQRPFFLKILPACMALFLLLALIICAIHITQLPATFSAIFSDAFTGLSVTGGAIGTVILAGFTCVMLSSQAGFGTSTGLLSKYCEQHTPLRAGIISTIEPIVTIFIVGTLTGLVIVSSGKFGNERYQALFTESQIKSQPVYLGSGWKSNSAALYPDKASLKRFSTTIGQYQFQPIADSIGIFEIQEVSRLINGKLIADAIRFSSWEQSVKTEVRILDSHSDLIAATYVPEVQDHPKAMPLLYNDIEIANITPKQGNGEWTSHLIKFSKPELSRLLAARRSESISIQLVGYGSSGSEWVVNRIEPVVGVAGTGTAFQAGHKRMGIVGMSIMIMAVVLIAVGAALAWYLIGFRALQSILGEKWVKGFQVLFLGLIILGAAYALTPLFSLGLLTVALVLLPIATAVGFFTRPIQTDSETA